VRGVAGDSPAQGFTIATVIGTQDRDTLRGVDYESPPGVTDEAEQTQTGLENMQTVINEKSLRLLAGRLEQYERAEAFLRFPEGARNFMSYRELRVWARGRGNGWGQDGDLQFFVKIGRDAHNFYFYRTPVNSGPGRAAWLPEVVVDFDKLFALRQQLQNSVLRESADSLACTGVDLALIARSGLPIGQPTNRRAACADGYMVYSVDPLTSPPSLAQVQELAVGMIRVGNGGGGTLISPTDTLELWVDDVRLTDVENTPGYAGQVAFNVMAGDIASLRVGGSMRDPHFRQLTEQPTFLANDGIDVASSVRLEKVLPGASAYSIPLTIGYSRGSSEPLFLSQTDIPAEGIIGLRTPKSEVTRYSIAVRRTIPMRDNRWAVLVNNLYATANMSRASSQSEFTEGGSRVWNAGVDYSLQANPRAIILPGWLNFGGDEVALLRWNPTSFRVSTEIGKLNDERRSFRSPVEIETDTGRRVTGISHVFRPINPLSFSADFVTTRDLRDYGDTSATSIIASLERERLLGIDVGLERERQLNTTLQFNPVLVPYVRPNLSWTTSSYMQRDPQSRQLVRTGDSTGAFRLPRRLSNNQTLNAGTSFVLSQAFRAWFGEDSRLGDFAARFDEMRLNYGRNLSSSFDAAPFSPGVGYAFAFGGRDDFLVKRGFTSTIASAGEQVSLEGGVRLTDAFNVTSRSLFTNTNNYTRRLDNTLAVIQGQQRQIPDIRIIWRDSLNWLKRIAWGDTLNRTRPFGWLRVISSLDMTMTMTTIRNETFAPSETDEGAGDQRTTVTKVFPDANVNVNWNDNGTLNTQFNFSKSTRADSVPGSATRSKTTEVGLSLSRSFRMPARWRMRSRLRATFNWSKARSTSYISTIGSAEPSRLADNGTDRFDLSAASDLLPSLGFRLQASHNVSFDNNYNRKFSQFFLTAQFTFVFQQGELR
jgi:cell surface protein SprA